MTESPKTSVEDILRGTNDGSGRPNVLLYEVFEKHGKGLKKPVLEWSYGEDSLPLNDETAQTVQHMLSEGALTRGPGEYVHHMGGHVQRLRLTNG
ncbi:MAG: hypothetical protein DI626_07195 [Micavibrio aeruginosavorus]|uniref:Uncharacterized protein n=1 Tax=Micavibrio aeruginosavorus TaxID=349221 RepID=A0A2W4ZWA7_9BACT|nr:MAG: hypothetical protein DI626_07195 [Micavibrio aeruginosavorus]